jgi:UDP-N-acetylmuramate dehydrogenase
MIDVLFEQLQRELRGRVLRDEPMSRHTTWRVGGPADLFIEPADGEDLGETLRILAAARCPWLTVGAGSNLLVKDGGIRGAVLHLTRLRRLEISDDGRVTAGAGLPLMTLIRATIERGLAGLEGLAGIPGTVGGGVVMNAGAGGQQLADVVEGATLVGPEGSEGSEVWSRERLAFGYRSSAVGAGQIISEARLRLHPGDPKALAAAFAGRLAERAAAQRVGGPNAGSVFKNPPGASAWRLIDAAGMRGAVEGSARVAERHSNFIVTTKTARAGDVLRLIERIRDQVRRQSGIELETEVKIVGEDR